MQVNTIVGMVFVILGMVCILNPKLAFDIKTFTGRKFFDMHVKASSKTYRAFRLLGVIYILIGLAFLINF